MSMKVNKTLPSPAELKKEYPLSDRLKEIKNKRDAEMMRSGGCKSSPLFL